MMSRLNSALVLCLVVCLALTQDASSSSRPNLGFPVLRDAVVERVAALSADLAALRAKGDFARADNAAGELYEIRRSEQGETWFAALDAREDVAELTALSRVPSSEKSLLDRSERLRTGGIDFLLKRARIDGTAT